MGKGFDSITMMVLIKLIVFLSITATLQNNLGDPPVMGIEGNWILLAKL